MDRIFNQWEALTLNGCTLISHGPQRVLKKSCRCSKIFCAQKNCVWIVCHPSTEKLGTVGVETTIKQGERQKHQNGGRLSKTRRREKNTVNWRTRRKSWLLTDWTIKQDTTTRKRYSQLKNKEEELVVDRLDDKARHDDEKKIQSTEEQGGRAGCWPTGRLSKTRRREKDTVNWRTRRRSWLLTDWTIKQDTTTRKRYSQLKNKEEELVVDRLDDKARHDDEKKIQSTEEQGGRASCWPTGRLSKTRRREKDTVNWRTRRKSWLLTDWTIKQDTTTRKRYSQLKNKEEELVVDRLDD